MCFNQMYVPYCKSANVDDYLDYLGNLSAIVDNIKCRDLCIMEDFNADKKNMLGKLLDTFCENYDLIISDHEKFFHTHLLCTV